MKCQYVGFKLLLGAGIPKASVLDSLLDLSKTSRKFRGRERFFLVGKRGDYIAGRWATLKGRKRMVVADVASGEMIWNDLPTGYELTAPNYFVIHTETLHGLYQRYAGSNSMPHFGDLLRSVTSAVAKPLRKVESEKARMAAKKAHSKAKAAKASEESGANSGPDEISAKAKSQLDERFSVNFFPLVRREKLDEVLAHWNTIRAMRYRVATVEPTKDAYGPLAAHTTSAVHELRLDRDARPSRLGALIAGQVGWLRDKFGSQLTKTTLIGKDELNVERRMDLGKLIDWFDEDHVEEVLTDQELNITDVVYSPLIQKMIKMAEDRPEYFSTVAE